MSRTAVAVIGGGPAGLMAAEVLSGAGVRVTVHEVMPSVGRKFLMAGRGGLNLTHSEDLARFKRRYGAAELRLGPLIDAFPPAALIAWAEGLGQQTFVGASGRVFPRTLKASPLLRAWLARLEAQGVEVRVRSRWTGWDEDGALVFADGHVERPDATVLALGGASWPRLGSTGDWVERLGAKTAPFRPANMGVDVGWSDVFRDRFEGQPLKGLAVSFAGSTARGDAVVTRYGLEGGAIYALSAPLRDAIESDGHAVLTLDLRPEIAEARLTERLGRPRGGQSLANHLRKAAGLAPLEANLLREAVGAPPPSDAVALARLIKAIPIRVIGVQPLARAISAAGGVMLDEIDERLMLRVRPGVFVAGEMLDWEAPTGGYLLQASFATGQAAARGALAFLAGR